MKKFLLAATLTACAPMLVKQEPAKPTITIAAIEELARNSSCASIHWGNTIKVPSSKYTSNRGPIFRGATAGIALNYARALCEMPQDVVAPLGTSSTKDQLLFMKPVFDKEGLLLGNDTERLRAVYASLFSFAAMESSGKHCEGRDEGSDNYDHDNVEAGMFQTSYNSTYSGVQSLKTLYADYKAGKKSCFRDVYAKNVTCSASEWKYWGSGEGVNFQKLSKECPAFATEYAAIMFRTQRSHYYPLNQAGRPEKFVQKWIDPRKECVDLLKQVEAKMAESAANCEVLK